MVSNPKPNLYFITLRNKFKTVKLILKKGNIGEVLEFLARKRHMSLKDFKFKLDIGKYHLVIKQLEVGRMGLYYLNTIYDNRRCIYG